MSSLPRTGRRHKALLLRIECDDEEDGSAIPIEAIADFIKDLAYLYDRLVILTVPRKRYVSYRDKSLTSYFYTRTGRPIEDVDKLRAVTIIHRSPLVFETIATGIAARLLYDLLKWLEAIS